LAKTNKQVVAITITTPL